MWRGSHAVRHRLGIFEFARGWTPEFPPQIAAGKHCDRNGRVQRERARYRQTRLVRSAFAPFWYRHRLDLERVRDDRIEFTILFPRRRTLAPSPAVGKISDR